MRLKWAGFVLLILMLILLEIMLVGCGVKAEVTVQLVKQSDNTPYAVAQMKVFLEDEKGKVASATTDATGKAVFPVTAKGKYQVIRVEGLDVTGGAEGAVGYEFVKASPISTSAPQTAHVYTVCPAATVIGKKDQVEITSPIPTVRKVTILKKGSVDTPDETNFNYYIPEAIAGRMIFSNKNCDCGGALYIYASEGTNRSMVFSLGTSEQTCTMRFWENYNAIVTLNTGNIGDTWTIEIPGNGDWAFTSGTTAFSRNANGTNDAQDSFTSFGKSPDLLAIYTYNYGITHNPPNDHYRFDFEVQKFEEL